MSSALDHSSPGDTLVPDRVELSVPADPAYLAVLRTACAGLAARLDLTLDEIEDLRIAIDEACTLLLNGDGADHEVIEAVFDLAEDTLTMTVHGPALHLPDRSSFAWAVLEALVGGIDTGRDESGAWIQLHHTRVAKVRT